MKSMRIEEEESVPIGTDSFILYWALDLVQFHGQHRIGESCHVVLYLHSIFLFTIHTHTLRLVYR